MIALCIYEEQIRTKKIVRTFKSIRDRRSQMYDSWWVVLQTCTTLSGHRTKTKTLTHTGTMSYGSETNVFSPTPLPCQPISCVYVCVLLIVFVNVFSYHECTHEHVHVCYAILPDKNAIGTFWALKQIWAILTFVDTCWSTWSGSARPVDARMALRICSDIPGALWILFF